MQTKGLLKYHIIGTLWVGQSSIIYRATDVRNQIVAVKMLLPATASHHSAQRMMKREARLALGLEHPNIVRAIEYVRDGATSALVMECFNAENLKTHIVRSSPLIREHAHGIIMQVCDALKYVHERGLVHLDMKPENVLVADDATTKIIDFALARPARRSRLLALFERRRIAGTRPYIAPETIRKQVPDVRTDIYSLGITIYEMLAGRPPFISNDRDDILKKHLLEQPADIRTYRKDVSVKMDELVLHMLSKRRAQRPETIDEVVRRMKDIQVFDKQGETMDNYAIEDAAAGRDVRKEGK